MLNFFKKILKIFRNDKIKKFRCLFSQKLSKLTLLISKNWIYYLIVSYLLRKPTNNRTRQKIQQNLLKCIKEQNLLGTKLIN